MAAADVADFNPRLREGGDIAGAADKLGYAISIHASAKEATATYCDTSAIMYISSLNNFFVHFFSFISQYVVLFFLF